jgi:hypothetical protein
MKLKLFIIVSCLLISTALFGMQTINSHFNNNVPFAPVRGDTDAYGYYSMEDTDPGGPSFVWFDTSSAWTKINGLGDDNNVGPYAIGWEFPYYWYKVDKFYFNSNGCISFSDPEVYMPQSASGVFIPSTNPPNDIVIPLGADLTFERDPDSGSVWYYSNNIDTLVISFLDVPCWVGPGAPEGSHFFQLILCKTDSTILFTYAHQHGGFYENTNCGGIEDVIGDVGVSGFWHACPDSGSAIKFFPPVSTTYQALDVGVHECMSPGGEGVFVFPDLGFVPWATIRNQGNVNATSFDVSCLIMTASGGVVQFADTITIPSLAAGTDTTVYFTANHPDSGWFPTTVDDYFAIVTTSLALDINPTNNVRDCEIIAMTIPGWLSYDSNPSSATGHTWQGADAGWGQEFEPPCYPMQIDSISIAMACNPSIDVPIMLLDDDGPGGSPGTMLWTDTVSIYVGGTAFDHFKFYINPPVIIDSGLFYVGFIQTGADRPSCIMEGDGPFSKRAWEYTPGAWAPFRERTIWEMMTRFYTPTIGVAEKPGSKMTYPLALTPARPNPMKKNTMIYYTLPTEGDVTLKVYNLLGQEVRTLVNGSQKAGLHSVTFNAKNSRGNRLPQGIYFYRLTAGERSLTNKITLLY